MQILFRYVVGIPSPREDDICNLVWPWNVLYLTVDMSDKTVSKIHNERANQYPNIRLLLASSFDLLCQLKHSNIVQ